MKTDIRELADGYELQMELPQFYNVLKGDMSLVGTRPPTEDEFEKYNQYYRRRISMTPGLTGLWQVSGRSEIENFDDVVKYDLKYIDDWSLISLLIVNSFLLKINQPNFYYSDGRLSYHHL